MRAQNLQISTKISRDECAIYILISNSFLRKLRTKDYVICDSSLEGEIGGDAFP